MRSIFLLSAGWMDWLLRLGGPGLVLVGLLDNSVVPTPGGMDLLTVILAASNPTWWWYYGAWATAGSLIGGYLTFRLGHKGGKETLEKKVPKDKLAKIYERIEKHNFLALFMPALLPPPVPMSPFILAAGACKMSHTSFFLALAPARLLRYMLIAWLGAQYGGWIARQFAQYRTPVLIIFIAVCVLGALGGYIYWRRRKQARQAGDAKEPAAA